jgi:uncharacterized membrane protein
MQPLPRNTHDDAPVTASKTADPDRSLLGVAVTINKPADELFAFWRDQRNLVTIMDNIESIEVLDDNRSRWTVKAPAGGTVSWVSEITHEVPNREITWQSADADVPNSGRITFTPAAGRGTVVRAVVAYDPRGGAVGKLVAKVFQREPRIQTRRDLRRFKQFMETGEIATAARNRDVQAEEKK